MDRRKARAKMESYGSALKHRDCCEYLEALESTFDSLMAGTPEPDPTTPDPVAYFKAAIRELEKAQTRITMWMEAQP